MPDATRFPIEDADREKVTKVAVDLATDADQKPRTRLTAVRTLGSLDRLNLDAERADKGMGGGTTTNVTVGVGVSIADNTPLIHFPPEERRRRLALLAEELNVRFQAQDALPSVTDASVEDPREESHNVESTNAETTAETDDRGGDRFPE